MVHCTLSHRRVGVGGRLLNANILQSVSNCFVAVKSELDTMDLFCYAFRLNTLVSIELCVICAGCIVRALLHRPQVGYPLQ